MRLIDVLVKQANKEIKNGAILKIPDEELFGKKSVFEFEFNKDHFYDEEGLTVEDLYSFDTDFLNSEVELIQPMEKKYLIKVNIQGLHESFAYLNYGWYGSCVTLNSRVGNKSTITHFTKSEMQSIQPIRVFLEDMQGKYKLIEVEE